MKSKFFGLSAKLALCFVAALGTLTSCYEKEDITTVVDTTPKTVTYTISGSVYNYASLSGINGASVVLTKGDVKKAETTTVKGQFAISLTKLTEEDRGDYTLTVTADGYKTRKTSVTIYFEKAANQTIATHLDFALKSNEIQGGVIEVVAGAEEQIEEVQGVDSEGNPTVDQVVIPEGLFGAGVTKTITFTREGQNEEIANDAVRVWEGKPDGTTFVKPLQFIFKDKPGQNLNVYYEINGVWVKDTKGGKVTENNGTYTAEVYHFSRFKFSTVDYSCEIDVVGKSEVSGEQKKAELKYYNGTNTNVEYPFELKGLRSGAKYGTPLTEVFANSVAPAIAIKYLENFLLSEDGGYSELPGDDFKNVTLETLLTVPAHNNLTGATTTETIQTIAYAMVFGGKSYTIVVDKLKDYTIVPSVYDYTHGHGIGHGHGHGDELNAGGGIITFE